MENTFKENTFKKYSKKLGEFINSILVIEPDYIVPVKKKGCKLLRYASREHYAEIDRSVFEEKVRYRDYFENNTVNLEGKTVAIIDDATKYTSSLKRYRDFFEERGANVKTFSFVGQDMIRTGEREQYDIYANIFLFLEEAAYQEYIVQQSFVLSGSDCFFDIDHFAVKTSMSLVSFVKLLNALDRIGEIEFTNDVYTPKNITKLCVFNIGFNEADYLFPPCISQGALQKIRIAYNSDTQEITIIPLSFPKWDSTSCDDYNIIFNNIDLILPYPNSDALTNYGIFFNIVYVYQLVLLRHFLDVFNDFNGLRDLKFLDQDMIAFAGNIRAKGLFECAVRFLKMDRPAFDQMCSAEKDNILIPRKGKAPFPNVLSIMEELRQTFNDRVKNNHTLLGVRYFLSYEELIERYTGRENLLKWIDILCDRGALVTRNYCEKGIYYRACRSGEMDPDHIEKCTSALISLAINCCATKITTSQDKEFARINATYLNKVLANFALDYPKQEYDIHSLYTRPYKYGPLTCVEDSISGTNGTIYTSCHPDMYTFDESEKDFVSVSTRDSYFNSLINSRIGRQTSVPYTEVTSYFCLMKKIRDASNTDTILNALAICRNEDLYTEHVQYNLMRGFEYLKEVILYALVTDPDIKIREAAKNIASAGNKLKFDQQHVIDIVKGLELDMVYDQTRERILESFIPFSENFIANTIPLFKKIYLYERIIVNILLFNECNDTLYYKRVKRICSKNPDISKVCLDELNWLDKYINDDYSEMDGKEVVDTLQKITSAICIKLYTAIQPDIKSLKKFKKYTVVQKHNTGIAAKNKIKRLINENSYEKIVLVCYSYSGFQNTTDARDINVIEMMQQLAVRNAKSGKLVLGATGDDPSGVFATDSIAVAYDFANKLSSFASLSGDINVRFGCSASVIGDNIDEDVKTVMKESLSVLTDRGFVLSKQGFDIAKQYYNDTFCKSFKEIKIPEVGEAYRYMNNVNELSRRDSEKDYSVTIGIITVLVEEYISVKAMLDNVESCVFPGSGSGHRFDIGDILSNDGTAKRIALARTLGEGNNKAAVRASNMIHHFPNLKVIFMVGIAGGTPIIPSHFPEYDKDKILELHVRLGDIVVGDSIIQYDYVRETIIETPKGNNIPPYSVVLEAKQTLEELEETTKNPSELPWNKYISKAQVSLKAEYKRPSADKDVLTDYNGEIVEHPQDNSRSDGYPKIFSGKIASANKLLKNPEKRDQLKRDHNVFAVEMETSGIADSTWNAGIGYFAVRGIVDYCDLKKNDIWHRYSALAAAAYTKALIEFM